jgi:ubiquitin carboxyl-terminal hydrolase 34
MVFCSQKLNLSFFSLARVSATEFAVAFWPLLAALIPIAVNQPHQCEETFALSHQLFKRLAETSLEFLNLDEFVREWGSLLLSLPSREVFSYQKLLLIKY